MASVEEQLQIVAAKENLQEKFEDFEAYSTSLASFTLQLKDLEDFLDSIRSSVEDRITDVESKLKLNRVPSPVGFDDVQSDSKQKQVQSLSGVDDAELESEQRQVRHLNGFDGTVLEPKREQIPSPDGSNDVQSESKQEQVQSLKGVEDAECESKQEKAQSLNGAEDAESESKQEQAQSLNGVEDAKWESKQEQVQSLNGVDDAEWESKLEQVQSLNGTVDAEWESKQEQVQPLNGVDDAEKQEQVQPLNGVGDAEDAEWESKQDQVLESFDVQSGCSISNVESSSLTHDGIDWFVSPRPELLSVCVKMDWRGLIAFLNASLLVHVPGKNSNSIRDEIGSAVLSVPDPIELLLDVLEGSASKLESSVSDVQLSPRSWSLLLQVLRLITPVIKVKLREKASKFVDQWKDDVTNDDRNHIDFRALSILLFAAYGSASVLEQREIFELVEIAALRPQAAGLCRLFGFTSRIPEFIQNLIKKRKQMEALNFILEFGLADDFPVFPLLKAHINDAKTAANKICKEGDNSAESQNEGTDIQIGAVSDVLRCIEGYKIECQYTSHSLRKTLERLRCEKNNKKRGATALQSDALISRKRPRKAKRRH